MDEESSMPSINLKVGEGISTAQASGLVDETELQISPNKTNRFSTSYVMEGDESKGLMLERDNSNEEDPWSMF